MIKGLSEQRRMPRLGKFHLGIKVTVVKDGKEITYPKAVDHFVPPEELIATLGVDCKSLDIMFPVEDAEKFASQYYKCYSSFRGLVCKGNGETCMRMIDTATGDFAHRDTKEVAMKECRCEGQDCPMYQSKKCKEVMNLQFLLPTIPGLGVWQLDTGSYHSIVTVNSALDLIKNVCGRVSMIPLRLTVEPKEVTVEGKKKNVHVLNVRCNATLSEIQRVAALPASQVTLPPPDEERPAGLVGTIEEGPLEEEPTEEEAKPAVSTLKPMSQKEADALFDGPGPKDAAKAQAAKPAEKPAPPSASISKGEAPPVSHPAAADTTLKRELDKIVSAGALFTACYEDWNMSRTDVAVAVGFKTAEELIKGTKPAQFKDHYRAIAAVKG